MVVKQSLKKPKYLQEVKLLQMNLPQQVKKHPPLREKKLHQLKNQLKLNQQYPLKL
jgi:hypothetical protein